MGRQIGMLKVVFKDLQVGCACDEENEPHRAYFANLTVTDLSRLTVKGIEQAKGAADFLLDLCASRNISFSKTYVSPLSRASETLALISSRCNSDTQPLLVPKPEIIGDLREIDLYEWQGLLKGEVMSRYPNEYEKWRGENAADFKLASGHYPVRELWRRAELVWEQVLRDAWSDGGGEQAGAEPRSVLMMGHNAMNQARRPPREQPRAERALEARPLRHQGVRSTRALKKRVSGAC